MRIALIDAPLGVGAGTSGTHLGPAAIHATGLAERLRALGHHVLSPLQLNVPEVPTGAFGDPQLRYLSEVLSGAQTIADAIAVIPPETAVVTLGGDHSMTLGTVTGVAQRLAPQRPGLLWVDAHGDFNTDKTSPSGNIHGMSLAALVGEGDERLVTLGGLSPKVNAANVVIFGARSLDDQPTKAQDERRLLRKHGVHVFTMRTIDELGVVAAARQAIALATEGGAPLHVSYDIDSVDPNEAPGTGTRVPGGLTYREARLLMELIAESGALRSLDLVEVNPTLDQAGKTSQLAATLICAAFGATLF